MKKKDIRTLNAWVEEAKWGSRDWREESWRDCEMYDGLDAQWSPEDFADAVDAGIDPLTINRTFPVVNMILGSEAINKNDIIAKARTQADSEISQVMTEAIRFVMDQCQGDFLVSQAFKDQTIPGLGCISPTLNNDPRKEKCTLKYRDWKEINYDPFSPPWWSPDYTRYVYVEKWMDIEDLQGLYPGKANEIQDMFDELVGQAGEHPSVGIDDHAWLVEENVRMMSGRGWVDTERNRIRPVEMWYPMWEECRFALFADGRCIQVRPTMTALEQIDLILSADQVIKTPVKKMQVCSFVNALELDHRYTPFPHDQYPFVPFVGYTDRLNQPFGVPRQIRGQDEEVNKRRSMALAMLKARSVIMEKDAVEDGDEGAQRAYEEAQKIDSFIQLKQGAMGKFQIQNHEALVGPQMEILMQSEREIQQVSGANAESMGYQSNAQSGVAIEKRQIQGAVTTSTLFANARRSLSMIGEQLVANIQGYWTAPKVLRITDRMTGADRFVNINEYVTQNGQVLEIRNNITQGVYDVVVSEAPSTDTVREQNMNLLLEWIKRAPEEAIPLLMQMAFEMSNLPNKDVLVAKLKPLFGGDPTEDDLSPEEVKKKMIAEMESAAEQQAKQAEEEDQWKRLEMKEKHLNNLKTEADIKMTLARIEEIFSDIKLDQSKFKAELINKVADVESRMLEAR